jgi:hypothetical protein
MENSSLDEFTKEQQQDFVNYEKELFKLLTIISEVEGSSLNSDFSIEFNEPNYSESKDVRLNNYVKEIDLGLKAPSEILAQIKKIPIEEAKRMLEDNIAERNALYNRVQATNQLNFDTTAQALGL